ncbi:MAG: riboflavin synthase [Bacteroidia bacterium]|nr:riboflavin synthase [Bacteroidia bacterium]MDW8159229.1 riboflavin synthase [Bacteroidia bacterium]
MFTGIVEALGKIENITAEGSNYRLRISAPFAHELKVDQSVAHNGCCLTVVKVDPPYYEVVLVEETLRRTNFLLQKSGAMVNLERSLTLTQRLDGHFVQGHVDAISELIGIEDRRGSYWMTFSLPPGGEQLIVEKGSICINGISLTIASRDVQALSVAIIPYTWQHTNLQFLKRGDWVNVEYDIIGKYVYQILKRRWDKNLL